MSFSRSDGERERAKVVHCVRHVFANVLRKKMNLYVDINNLDITFDSLDPNGDMSAFIILHIIAAQYNPRCNVCVIENFLKSRK